MRIGCSFILDKKCTRTSLVSSYSRYGLWYERLQAIRKIPARTKPAKRASANLHFDFPVENIDNRVCIMPVDRVDGSWGVIDGNDFNLLTTNLPAAVS